MQENAKKSATAREKEKEFARQNKPVSNATSTEFNNNSRLIRLQLERFEQKRLSDMKVSADTRLLSLANCFV